MNQKLQQTKTPDDYLNSYLHRVYDADPLTKLQRIEVSCAFHAGIEAMFKFINEYIDSDEEDEVAIERLTLFRKQNIDCATDVNLSRFGEE